MTRTSPLSLAQLRVFAVVASCGSVSEAARRLFVTQPAVTARLKAIEESLGAQLFERVSGRIRLTESGAMLLDYSRRLIALSAEAEAMLREASLLGMGSLRVAGNITSASYHFPPVFSAFRKIYPGTLMKLSVMNSANTIASVARLDVDVGMIGGNFDNRAVECHSLFKDGMVLVTAKDTKFRRISKLSDLAGLPVVAREPGSSARRYLEEQMQSHGVSVNIVFEAESNEAIKAAVKEDVGFTIISRAAVNDEIRRGALAAPRLPPLDPLQINLIVHKDRQTSPLISGFVRVALESAAGHGDGAT